MLLDEPLVNLDYKLREELREELSALFASGESTVVYATTEPTEALLLGGYAAVLDAGELLQYGPTPEVFHRPRSIRVARAFSDPPMNLVEGQRVDRGSPLPSGQVLPVALPAQPATGGTQTLTVGIRASALRMHARATATCSSQAASSWPRSRGRTLCPRRDAGRRTGPAVAGSTASRSAPDHAVPGAGAGLCVRRIGRPGRRAGEAHTPGAELTAMARITLDLAHAYRPNLQRDEDYALLPLKMTSSGTAAPALLGPSVRQDDAAQHRLRAGAARRAASSPSTAATSPRSRRSSATSPRCSSSR